MAKKSETTTATKKKSSAAASSKSAKNSGGSSGKKAANTKTNSKSANTKANAKNSASRAPAQAPAKKPVRREIGGVVCIILALLCFIGYFDVDALFFVVTDVMKGLIGYGYWILPPCLLWVGGVLLTHRGRPVRLRMTAILLLPTLWGVMGHILFFGVPLAMSQGFVNVWTTLYVSGKGMHSGGAMQLMFRLHLQSLHRQQHQRMCQRKQL